LQVETRIWKVVNVVAREILDRCVSSGGPKRLGSEAFGEAFAKH
jgi:hypothetical protein